MNDIRPTEINNKTDFNLYATIKQNEQMSYASCLFANVSQFNSRYFFHAFN